MWPDVTQRVDDDGSPGRVASIDQWTTPLVGKAPQPRQKPAPAVRQTGVHGMKGPTTAKSTTDAVFRVSPDLARATAREKARKLETALQVMSDVDGLHHEVRKAVGRDRCATSCRTRVIDRSQGQVGAVAVRGGPVCRPSRFRITGRHSNAWSICSRRRMHWRKSCK